MDQQAEQLQLESEKEAIQRYLDHPISQKIEKDNLDGQTALLTTLIDLPIVDLESLIKHFEARGHLRGLRRARALVADSLEEIEDKLKDIKT